MCSFAPKKKKREEEAAISDLQEEGIPQYLGETKPVPKTITREYPAERKKKKKTFSPTARPINGAGESGLDREKENSFEYLRRRKKEEEKDFLPSRRKIKSGKPTNRLSRREKEGGTLDLLLLKKSEQIDSPGRGEGFQNGIATFFEKRSQFRHQGERRA